LYTYLHKDPEIPSQRQKVVLLQDIVSALTAIHEFGICHRDIKSSNVLILVLFILSFYFILFFLILILNRLNHLVKKWKEESFVTLDLQLLEIIDDLL